VLWGEKGHREEDFGKIEKEPLAENPHFQCAKQKSCFDTGNDTLFLVGGRNVERVGREDHRKRALFPMIFSCCRCVLSIIKFTYVIIF
jgi:hypothetical protein